MASTVEDVFACFVALMQVIALMFTCPSEAMIWLLASICVGVVIAVAVYIKLKQDLKRQGAKSACCSGCLLFCIPLFPLVYALAFFFLPESQSCGGAAAPFQADNSTVAQSYTKPMDGTIAVLSGFAVIFMVLRAMWVRLGPQGEEAEQKARAQFYGSWVVMCNCTGLTPEESTCGKISFMLLTIFIGLMAGTCLGIVLLAMAPLQRIAIGFVVLIVGVIAFISCFNFTLPKPSAEDESLTEPLTNAEDESLKEPLTA